MSILILSSKVGRPKAEMSVGLDCVCMPLPPLLLPAFPPFPAWPGLQLLWETSDHRWLRGGNPSPVDQAEAPGLRLCPPACWGWRAESSPLPQSPGLAMGLAMASSLLSS